MYCCDLYFLLMVFVFFCSRPVYYSWQPPLCFIQLQWASMGQQYSHNHSFYPSLDVKSEEGMEARPHHSFLLMGRNNSGQYWLIRMGRGKINVNHKAFYFFSFSFALCRQCKNSEPKTLMFLSTKSIISVTLLRSLIKMR